MKDRGIKKWKPFNAVVPSSYLKNKEILKEPSLSENEMADVRLDDMGFIFQQMYMMKNLSILDNIILPAVKSSKHKESRSAVATRGRLLMKKLGIELPMNASTLAALSQREYGL